MIYAEETYDDVIDEIKPLLTANHEEIAFFDERVPLIPNYHMYKELEDQGFLSIFTVRTDERELIGYCIIFITPHIHYSTTVMATVDIIYINPAHRGKMAGIRLIKFTEKTLKERGVDIILHRVPKQNDFSPMLKRLGYTEAETVYSHYIGA
jgi:GNAT superfamily N-acetyltransferase